MSNHHCWMNANLLFITSFLVPLCTIVLINMGTLSIAIYRYVLSEFFFSFFGSFSTDFLLDRVCQLERRSNYLLRQARGLLSLSFILGSTWLIGVLGIFHSSIAVTYIFTTLNSLQGLFIFIFHVLWSDACRQVFRNFFQWFTEEDIKSSADITSVNRAGQWDILGEFFKHYACLLLIEVSVYLYCLCSFYRIQMKNYCLIRPSFSFQKI